MKEENSDNKKRQEKIIFKFKLWGIFFLLIIFLHFITSNLLGNNSTNNQNNGNNNITMNYSKMKNNLINNNIQVEYIISDYVIRGNISNNELIGILEYNNQVYNIKYDGINLYEINNDSEEISNLLGNINKLYLLPKNIIKILNETDNIGIKNENKYSYNYNNIDYEVIINNDKIANIVIKDNMDLYNLKYIEIIN